ncbi:MAG: tRNA (adenosine(37)-N6)-threonylcarbamoyltransferase complex ATPase subunit type 1 TsaE [Patescibacteria group bacterium]|nr:tRNA (adenosine(37)-N6)-threonylcarbamoyltransferase complex ATPase subunit type 1 TsaE [Patescibacteria group bacterium]
MNPLIFNAANEADTVRLGGRLADLLPAGSTVALCGTLGAGKTRLVQAVAESLGVPSGEVVSPTFVLIKEYAGRLAVYHFDAYRVRDDDEFLELGPDEYFESGGIAFVEWADRVRDCMPREHLRIDIDVTGRESRRFTVRAIGARYEPVLQQL